MQVGTVPSDFEDFKVNQGRRRCNLPNLKKLNFQINPDASAAFLKGLSREIFRVVFYLIRYGVHLGLNGNRFWFYILMILLRL
jgi:hypothetical protein